MSAKEEFEKKIRAFVGQEIGPAELGADRVNEPMIRHWCEVLGDRNPVYLDAAAAASSVHRGLVAPPAMLQAWILEGFGMSDSTRGPRDKQQELHRLFDEAGYTGVVATDCEQGYDRYLRPGDEVSATTVIESISGHAEVRQLFVIPRRGTVAGCFVPDGVIKRSDRMRIIRDGIPIYSGPIDSLRHHKDDVREVRANQECGIRVANYDDYKVGDILECYGVEEQPDTL